MGLGVRGGRARTPSDSAFAEWTTPAHMKASVKGRQTKTAAIFLFYDRKKGKMMMRSGEDSKSSLHRTLCQSLSLSNEALRTARLSAASFMRLRMVNTGGGPPYNNPSDTDAAGAAGVVVAAGCDGADGGATLVAVEAVAAAAAAGESVVGAAAAAAAEEAEEEEEADEAEGAGAERFFAARATNRYFSFNVCWSLGGSAGPPLLLLAAEAGRPSA